MTALQFGSHSKSRITHSEAFTNSNECQMKRSSELIETDVNLGTGIMFVYLVSYELMMYNNETILLLKQDISVVIKMCFVCYLSTPSNHFYQIHLPFRCFLFQQLFISEKLFLLLIKTNKSGFTFQSHTKIYLATSYSVTSIFGALYQLRASQ